MALPTKGRVIIETTFGEIDIELWAKETPKACRNFIALALEGYYDGVIFHRVVPGFLAQTGDRTGTGNGGESFYGEPFEDEIHPRLRYTHRGLVGMANNGTRHSNDSQFFITLDRADELHGKHTLFGRVVGDTIYNVMKLSELELDKNGRPVYPPKIKSIKIIDNPFDDIIPRITAAERRAQQRAREEAQRAREEEVRRRGAKKNTKLLSFGEEEGGEEEEEVVFKKKPIFRPDLAEPEPSIPSVAVVPDFVVNPAVAAGKDDGDDKQKQREKEREKDKERKASEDPAPEKASKKEKKRKDKGGDGDGDDITKIREKHAMEQMSSSDARRAQIAQMEAEIKKMTRRYDSDDSDDDMQKKKKPKKSYLEEELAKYTSKSKGVVGGGKKGRKKDESDVLAVLDGFRDKGGTKKWAGKVEVKMNQAKGGGEGGEGEDPPMEVDNDFGFLTHSLHFPKGNEEEEEKAEREYEVIDPRARGAKAREEERERKRIKTGKGGGSGSRYGGGGRGGAGYYKERVEERDRDRSRR
ncbi:peptidyl-prolyl cis-trans isomerase [Coprinopsis cinerea AmutBmut pab1-1]|nr:peptidyl-prolyl cis-trans isomerase [Coprinopsis cinerea AmutBmut pab1-1]